MAQYKIKCFVCKENHWKPLYKKLLKCSNCGFIRAKDKYFNIKPVKLYDINYFLGRDYENYQDEKNALILNFRDRLEKILKYKSSGKLLEIGCAFGYFLRLAEKKFITTGIDLNPETTKLSKRNTKKSKILTGDFLKIPFRKNSQDIVCMFDVIEHLKDPKKYISKINKILKVEGIFVLETGDIEALLPKVQKSKWRLITPPTHLSYFGEKTIKKLLTENGFEIIFKKHVSFHRTLKQIIYRITRNRTLSSIFDKLNLSFEVNTFDLIFVIAQKTS